MCIYNHKQVSFHLAAPLVVASVRRVLEEQNLCRLRLKTAHRAGQVIHIMQSYSSNK